MAESRTKSARPLMWVSRVCIMTRCGWHRPRGWDYVSRERNGETATGMKVGFRRGADGLPGVAE